MAKGVNKVILVGHVGRDPEITYLPSGKAVVNLSMATTEKRQDGEHTEWHRLVFFSKLAEITNEYVRKGSLIYVCGRIQTREWTDANGGKRSNTEVVVNEMQMLDKKSEEPHQADSVRQDFDEDIPF